MLGLYIKDILFLKENWLKKKFVFPLILGLILAIFLLKEDSIIISIFITLFILNSIQMIFTSDIKSGWIEFLNSTALTTKEIVCSRFMTALTIILFSSSVSFILNIVLYFSFSILSLKEYLIIALIVTGVSIIYILILLPFIYLFDQNALTVAFIILIAITFLISKAGNFLSYISHLLQNSSFMQIITIFIIGILLLAVISFVVSIIIYKERFINK